MHRRAAVLGTAMLLAVSVLLTACGMPADASVPEVTSSASPTPPPAPPAPPPPNDLGTQRITEIATVECPGAVTAQSIRMLVQDKADAVSFFASTKQCGDIAQVLAAGDAVRTFVSPLQYIDGPCLAGNLLTVWAHYDDDLIFGSPTIPNALDAGQCVRNFYLTGSDAGKGLKYGYGREDGLRDAYDVLLGSPHEWEERTVTLANGIVLAMSRPIGEPRVSLYFLRLPDGGLRAEGFESTGWESLPRLLSGTISEMHVIDTGAPVNLDAISSTLVELYNAYLPGMVLAHLPGRAEGTTGDHPDHQVTGDIVMTATDAGQLDQALVTYVQGYPSEKRAQNLSGDVLQRTLEAFAVYGKHDSVIHCSSADTCLDLDRFGSWLARQYLVPHSELVRP